MNTVSIEPAVDTPESLERWARLTSTPPAALAAWLRVSLEDAERIQAAVAAIQHGIDTCPPWCVTGPHEAFPTDRYDDGARLHTSAYTETVCPDGTGDVEIYTDAQWLDRDGLDPFVFLNVGRPGRPPAEQTLVELELPSAVARAIAAQLVAAADVVDAQAATLRLEGGQSQGCPKQPSGSAVASPSWEVMNVKAPTALLEGGQSQRDGESPSGTATVAETATVAGGAR